MGEDRDLVPFPEQPTKDVYGLGRWAGGIEARTAELERRMDRLVLDIKGIGDDQKEILLQLVGFRTKVMTAVTIGCAIGTPLAAVIAAVIVHYLNG